MQRSIAPYIKHSSENNNSSSLNEKLQLGIGISGVFSGLALINHMKKNEVGGYKRMNGRRVRDPPSIYPSNREFKGEIGSRKQKLLDRLSNYDHITPMRRASLKRHGSTAGWLTKSTELATWISDPKSNIFTLSGKRESYSKINDQYTG